MRQKGRLYNLLVSLLLLLFVYPYFEKSLLAEKLLALFFTFILVSGVLAVSGQKRVRLFVSIFLAVPAVVLIWFNQFFTNEILNFLTLVFPVFFSFFTMFCIVSFLMRARKVTSDILAGAASAYLLIGISWGLMYMLLEVADPGSFTVNISVGTDILKKWSTFNYYSFTTLTTTGYGDITPLSSRAQSLALLEMVFGVLFTALLISRLVGMYLYQLREDK